jgi:hypothetical protein
VRDPRWRGIGGALTVHPRLVPGCTAETAETGITHGAAQAAGIAHTATWPTGITHSAAAVSHSRAATGRRPAAAVAAAATMLGEGGCGNHCGAGERTQNCFAEHDSSS